MAADLHIHVFAEGELTDEDFKCAKRNSLGSRWFGGFNGEKCPEEKVVDDERMRRYKEEIEPFMPEGARTMIDAPKDLQKKWDKIWQDLHEKYGYQCSHKEKVDNTANVHVGEVSWLKAALFDDPETFIPKVVEVISEVIGEHLPVIDDELIAKIEAAYDAGNTTGYHVESKEEVLGFLRQHKGKRAFTISW